MGYFIKPELVTLDGYTYRKKYRTYSEYNYLRPGSVIYLKTRHFEYSLALTKKYFHQCNVIDFGCGDGIFLPSLAKYFGRVLGIDKDPEQIKISSRICVKSGLGNAEAICNGSLSWDELRAKTAGGDYQILYLQETLEHVGDRKDLYGSKIDFLKDLFTLIEDKGIIVISVPVMVGIAFLVKKLGSRLAGGSLGPVSPADLIKASFFADTSGLEKNWKGGHLGFNHLKLEKHLRAEFDIIRKKDLLSNIIYVIQKRGL